MLESVFHEKLIEGKWAVLLFTPEHSPLTLYPSLPFLKPKIVLTSYYSGCVHLHIILLLVAFFSPILGYRIQELTYHQVSIIIILLLLKILFG